MLAAQSHGVTSIQGSGFTVCIGQTSPHGNPFFFINSSSTDCMNIGVKNIALMFIYESELMIRSVGRVADVT